ncbi:long-chain-fatty-acid--CoA ligase [Nocardia xishanensis]|uniref:Long-chain-fatty-acid--CoA ligase n=1 Tax=Nocardia xishanensis TaxID=238964 RepID=A0ABW7XCB4_9NOCA
MHLTNALHRAVRQNPRLPATIFGDRVRTWEESAERIARLGSALKELGVQSGDRVAILSLNSDAFHEYLFAVPWADGVIAPMNYRWSLAEIIECLNDSEPCVLFVDDAFSHLVEQLRAEVPSLRAFVFCGEGSAPAGTLQLEELIAGHESIPDARRGGDALAALYYTGGTTGRPRGVMLSHLNLVSSALGAQATGAFVIPGGRHLHSAPLFHLGAGAGWLARNLAGGSHVILQQFAPEPVADAISKYEVTDAILMPTMIQMLVDSPDTQDHDLSSLQRLIYGASPISDALLERAAKRLPGVGFSQIYGMTETSPVTAVLDPAAHNDAVLRRSAGRAAPHAEVMIVDNEDREIPSGQVGEVVIRGPHVMRGYWNLPEMSAETLRGGWMHTGDGGYVDANGYLFIVDRIKDMIISGGENVYSTEVENALATHPAVASCVVIGVPDEEWGERVHAVVVCQPGTTTTAAELRTHCKGLIAGYKTPRSVDFVDALPTTAAGKVLKRELRSRYWPAAGRQVS